MKNKKHVAELLLIREQFLIDSYQLDRSRLCCEWCPVYADDALEDIEMALSRVQRGRKAPFTPKPKQRFGKTP